MLPSVNCNNHFPIWYSFLFFTCLSITGINGENPDKCQLSTNTDSTGAKALQRLEPLYGMTRDVTEYDSSDVEKSYFRVKICGEIDSKHASAGVIQYDKDYKTPSKVVGLIKSVTASTQGNYIHLAYHDGEMYNNSLCNNTHRTAEIMFICDELEELGKMKLLEKQDDQHCFYLFEVGTRYACQHKDGLSGGSIFCILFFTGVFIYVLLGFLYQRLVVGAKGLEQIPNYSFWRDFGNLQADGCDFFCRCGPRQEAQSYRGIDERGPRDDERDDQLLNM